MKLLTILKTKIQQLRQKPSDDYASQIAQANERLAKMERNYLVLLKRLLEMDGIRLVPTTKAGTMTAPVMQTNNSDINKGLNEHKPTIH